MSCREFSDNEVSGKSLGHKFSGSVFVRFSTSADNSSAGSAGESTRRHRSRPGDPQGRECSVPSLGLPENRWTLNRLGQNHEDVLRLARDFPVAFETAGGAGHRND